MMDVLGFGSRDLFGGRSMPPAAKTVIVAVAFAARDTRQDQTVPPAVLVHGRSIAEMMATPASPFEQICCTLGLFPRSQETN
jgi:hypothetical protein